MSESNINNMLQKIYEGQQEINRKIEKLDTKVEVKYNELNDKIEKLDTKVEVKYNELNDKIEKLDTKLEEKYTKLNNSIIKIEVEHGEKLQALFDAFNFNQEKNEKIKKEIKKAKKILDRHDERIYFLERKMGT